MWEGGTILGNERVLGMSSEAPVKDFLAVKNELGIVNKVTVSHLLLLLLDVVMSGGDTWDCCSHLVTMRRATS